jgi:hypothetical protein
MSLKFTLSIPPSDELESPYSSPATSPIGQDVHPYNNLNLDSEPLLDVTPGIQPKDVYDTSLSWWRAAIRRRLVENIRWESIVIARMQVSNRILNYAPFAGTLLTPPFHIGESTYSMARRLFRLHFLSRHTYILHDRPSSHVFLWTS